MSRSRQRKGAAGEEIAVKYLKKLGYKILHRNLRLSRYEIDVICRHENCLVFVEVKHSLTEAYGHPATWVDERKQEKLHQAARMYIDKHQISGLDIRFDVITVDKGKVEYFQNAF
jgi:putative endonuclease